VLNGIELVFVPHRERFRQVYVNLHSCFSVKRANGRPMDRGEDRTCSTVFHANIRKV
jgi:hypothetical protein